MKNFCFPVLVLTLFVTGCVGSDSDNAQQGDQPEETVNFLRQRDVGGPHAGGLLIGKLALVEGCLRIQSDDDPEGIAAIWPHVFDYRVQNGVVGILDWDDRVVAQVGDRVDVGGGAVSASSFAEAEWEELVIGDTRQCGDVFWIVSVVEESSTP